ncbi:tRNA 5-methoxyuridine(34)/uridine 5-oxyacetic acid(34) synthase CmoB [Solemya velum gill symbiont]|uniref:tRNA 5-methoxyuridine(34)/uridine 5-oxyacetic acid(34) synthase CmoB n=1 Tax=Solemya velum gill symbiont TaxID=2340 RepID=UPI0009961099|nr:tRNA 5-methoxyuridine(34)/uridine 5-oxyacetic acid(34) synthase CmoB [Solemya velum gill symbiont]OOZ43626.1 tRNA 5-methoxyuridine(34)/uridine 5-oxyacetic acid(34) synthase CmoB [Solemya velum gill symbiont]OOZ45156.1 tRNA 5-methoxyuridine(34)/uridine 5-oxyacetic acid(34) synthase CmoB [Solemya velum gill symbiont]OOZ48590.1 tRNA 5-methoxyuridine(34)/uridine 5-oxyacetic acid(34) synthase CmoB [Solemya velum gill symbiont]OOZ50488.1 tRNA 5-methoxyuridine(34)/uridine 5-oxyacetic acid(34) synth
MQTQLIDLQRLTASLRDLGMEAWAESLPEDLERLFAQRRHGDVPRWQAVLDELPEIADGEVDLGQCVAVTSSLPEKERDALKALLLRLSPWRKGPFHLHGVDIETEWRSDWKWERVKPHISPLAKRSVLDIGCGSGYHAWRMAGEGASLVVGVDPSLLFLMQFNAVRHFIGNDWPVHLLPIGIEQLPSRGLGFDTLFSMGILYHRRSPIEHLLDLKNLLRPGGELVLETLVIEGGENSVLVPESRYAKMRNVWFIPSTEMLMIWLRRAGFRDVRLVDLNRTSIEEQHSTEWMQFESLPDFLDPRDSLKTVEGYPVPLRATLIATL